jgi:hypothetical protein
LLTTPSYQGIFETFFLLKKKYLFETISVT